MINLKNYEAFFIRYVDEELTMAEQQMVEAFITLHPHLAAELASFLHTKAQAPALDFNFKEELYASAMKLATTDEALLLFVDDELPAKESAEVEHRILNDATYSLQYSLLAQARLTPPATIHYPNKKELYRYTETERFIMPWMRVAAAVIFLVLASVFYFTRSENNSAVIDTATTIPIVEPKKQDNIFPPKLLPENKTVMVQVKRPSNVGRHSISPAKNKSISPTTIISTENDVALTRVKPAVVAIESKNYSKPSTVALNNIVASSPVTFANSIAYNNTEAPEESIVTYGDEKPLKNAPAKSFLRKVSRFIERKTGIGTVNSDNSLLIGVVAFNLK